jgi:uncharacterized membrane protein YqjE
MALGRTQERNGRVPALLGNIVDGFGRLVSEHVALAKLELAKDATGLARQLGKLVIVLPFIAVGYAFICAAVVAVMVPWMSLPAALALIGAVNLGIGSATAYGAWKQLKRPPVMEDSLEELGRSVSVLKGNTHPTEAQNVRG